MKREIEGGDNMRDLSELHAYELGEIVWQHRSGATDIYIAKRLRAKLWQVTNYIRDVKKRFGANAEMCHEPKPGESKP